MSKDSSQSVALSTPAISGVLVGRYDYAMDPKKRFTIPSGWRTVMGNPEYVYVMPDRKERCLNLIPRAEMEARLEKLREKAKNLICSFNINISNIVADKLKHIGEQRYSGVLEFIISEPFTG